MPSHALLERAAGADRSRARELLVLWRHPADGRIIPIGRLAYDQGMFTFDYTVAASRIEGFRPLPGLGRVGERFESPSLPTIILQRVMDRDRSDFGSYVRSLGLTPETATPWEQIVESGGERAGDTLQFMECPEVREGVARTRFLANGVRHLPGEVRIVNGIAITVSKAEHEAALRALHAGDHVEIVPETGNAQDENATLITRSGVPLGWVPRFLAPSFRRLLAGDRLFARVARVAGPEAPPHVRLVLDLEARAPEGFSFDPKGEWAAVNTSAG